MHKFDEAAYRDFAEMLRARVAAHSPEWTGGEDSDPGVTLVELFAFLTESLLFRANQIPERGRSSALRLAQFASALAAASAGSASGTLERLRYFTGQVLSPDDLTLEQDYVRTRLRRLNRALYGSGIVSGLGISVQRDGTGEQVVVEPGFAIDARGEEIAVSGGANVALPQTGRVLYAVLVHCERPVHPQPTPTGTQFSRITEGFAVRLDVAATGAGVPLASLIFRDGSWHLDATFKPPRIVR
jgi:hypothetical protein